MASGASSLESNGSGPPSLNQHYLTLRKYEEMKDEYESLRKRHEDLIANHSAAVNGLEIAQDELARTKKQCEGLEQERNAVTRERNGLKQQCTAAIRQWDKTLREMNEYREALAKIQQQHDDSVKDITQALQMKAAKDLKRLTEERNAAIQESALIMSERDTVLKEMEKLSEDLTEAFMKIDLLETQNKEYMEEKKALSLQIETLKREIQSALHDRDKALKECNDLREKFGEYTANEESIQSFKSRLDFSPYCRERDNMRKDQAEDSSSNRDMYGKSQKERVDNLDQANQEIEKLRKQIDKLQAELSEAIQEAEVSKRRRDWAFSERDKIVLERESIRTLCDTLRKERDRAVSNLVVAIRDSDDIKKQRNDASKELKELKERMEAQMEKESRIQQYHGDHNRSHDSAIDADLHEWDVEIFDINLSSVRSDEDLGFDLIGGRDDPHYPNDSGIYVSAIAKGSIMDGKLKVNDCITRVNNLDCSNVSKRMVLEAVRMSGNSVNLMVKRRRVGGRYLYTTQLQWHRNFEHGLTLEGGVYISKISPGSLAAKEGNLAVGDRVLSINNKTMDGLKNTREAMNLLEDSGELITITTLKAMNVVQSGSSEDDRGFGNWSKLPPRNDHYEQKQYVKMINSSSQTDNTSFTPIANPEYTVISRPLSSSAFDAVTKPKQNIKETKLGNQGTWDILREKIQIGRTPKSAKREDKKHKDVTPCDDFKREQVDAIAELDSVINIYHTKQSKRKERGLEQNGGTWPKVRAGPIIHQTTGTVHHPKKTKVRQPLSVVLSHTGNPFQTEVRTRNNRTNQDTQRPVSDFGSRIPFTSKTVQLLSSRNSFSPTSLKEPSIEFDQEGLAPSDGSLDFSVRSGTTEKDVIDYYVGKKSNKYGGSDSESNLENHLRTHQQLYVSQTAGLRSLPHYQYQPHPHPHPIPSARYPSPSHSGDSISTYCFEPPYTPTQPYHTHSPSVDLHYAKSRSMPPGHSHPVYRADESPLHGYDGGTFPRNREARIRIPSNPSVTSAGKVSTGSIERTSERGSPMPNCYVEIVNPGRESKRNTLPDYLWIHNRPSPGELRKVHIEKSLEPLRLGIQICCPTGGGVFVSHVRDNSLASQVGLQVGDQVLEVCGINLRNATHANAATVLQQCGDSITMLVQYSPDKYHEAEGLSNSNMDEDRSRSGSPTPCNSPSANRKSTSESGTVRGLPGKSTLTRSHLSQAVATLSRQIPISRSSGENCKSIHEPRYLYIQHKKCSDLGISLVGGNAVGIFVHSVQSDSLAQAAGLRTGDQILEYCGTDLRQATAEEAAYELAKPADKVSIRALYNLDRYNEVKDKPGDSFYIRALFERSGDLNDSLQMRYQRDKELPFHKDDVLYVNNTMYNSVPGHWFAWLVDEDGQKKQCGVIPSKFKVEEELLRRSMGDLESDARRSTSSARRSFFKRKKHQRSSSRDSKELASFSTVNLGWYSDSGTLNEDANAALQSYQRVERFNYSIYRPVILIGPFSDCVTDRLLQDFPSDFTRCMPQIMHCSQTHIEKGMTDMFIDYRKKNNGNYYECTTLAAVREICDKKSHCILDISLPAVERLHKHQIYPIVLLIKFKSTKQIKEVKDTRYTMDKVSAKAAKEMYEHALKQESEYRHLISAVIQVTGVSIAYMCTLIKSAIDGEQNKTLWVPCSSS